MISKYGFIISKSFLSPHREISFVAAQLYRDVCTSCINYTRLFGVCSCSGSLCAIAVLGLGCEETALRHSGCRHTRTSVDGKRH